MGKDRNDHTNKRPAKAVAQWCSVKKVLLEIS